MNSHAYRQNLSTATALLQLVDELHNSTDKNLISQLLALDKKAAFDCVSHTILLDKLQRYGCSSTTITWMRNYLEFRSQYISIGRHKSKIVATSRGVPQGSILGPLLYLVYTNKNNEVVRDPNCTNDAHEDRTKLFGNNCNMCGKIITYADDTTYHIVNKHRAQNRTQIEVNMRMLEEFLNDNDLIINAEKTANMEAMIKQKRGRTPSEPPNLVVTTAGGHIKTIKDKREMRILGTNLEQNRSWMSPLENGKKAILPATRKKFGNLQQLGKMLPRASRKLLAEGLLISKMTYVIPQWGGAANNQILLAQILQNIIARWITGCGKKIRISSLLEEVGWFSIRELTEIRSLVQIWKVINVARPEMIREKITVNQDHTILMDHPRLQFTQQAFTWRTTTIWNSLPQNLREPKSLPTFKRRLKCWIKKMRDISIEPD